jgi:NTP pyrophosphatase (non-canonical NTP hydrolase)
MSDAAIHDRTVREQLQDEIGDVANLLLLLCSRTGIALEDAVIVKLEKNATKYPIDRTGGNADPPGHRMAGE